MNIRILCLGMLSIKEASGYEMKREIEDGMFSHFIEASFGSIYPALAQMTAEGLLTVRSEEQSGRPDKKVYAITPAGRDALAKGLSVVPARDKFKSEFLFEMLFRDLLSDQQINIAVTKQHADLNEDLQRIAHCKSELSDLPHDDGGRFVAGYGERVLTAARDYLEAQYPHLLKTGLKAAE